MSNIEMQTEINNALMNDGICKFVSCNDDKDNVFIIELKKDKTTRGFSEELTSSILQKNFFNFKISKNKKNYNKQSIDKFKDKCLELKGKYYKSILKNVSKTKEEEQENALIEEGMAFKILVEALNNFHLKVPNNNNIIDILKKAGNDYIVKDNFIEIYGYLFDEDLSSISKHLGKETYKYECNDGFFNGKIIDIENIQIKKILGTQKLETTVFVVRPTTYITRYGLISHTISYYNKDNIGNNYIEKNKLLKEYSEVIIKFYAKENKLQDALRDTLNDTSCNISMMKAYNKYLKQSSYLHILSIAGCVITTDQYSLLAKRNKSLEHASKVMCSFTGYLEFFSDKIDKYQYSDVDDRPTLIVNDCKQNINDEIKREISAELGTTVLKIVHNGFIISGPEYKKDSQICSSIDIEIFSTVNVNSTIKEVLESHKHAFECYENSKLIPIKAYGSGIIKGIYNLIKFFITLFMFWFFINTFIDGRYNNLGLYELIHTFLKEMPDLYLIFVILPLLVFRLKYVRVFKFIRKSSYHTYFVRKKYNFLAKVNLIIYSYRQRKQSCFYIGRIEGIIKKIKTFFITFKNKR